MRQHQLIMIMITIICPLTLPSLGRITDGREVFKVRGV